MLTVLELAAVVLALYQLGKLDYLPRIAGTIGFFCGAILEAVNLSIDGRRLAEWGLAGLLIIAVLFQREIRQSLR